MASLTKRSELKLIGNITEEEKEVIIKQSDHIDRMRYTEEELRDICMFNEAVHWSSKGFPDEEKRDEEVKKLSKMPKRLLKQWLIAYVVENMREQEKD